MVYYILCNKLNSRHFSIILVSIYKLFEGRCINDITVDFFTSSSCKTNSYHVAVHLFSNSSQKMSKYGNNIGDSHSLPLFCSFNNIRRKWRLGAQRQLYTLRATQPLQDGTTPCGQQYPQPSHEPPPQCREKTKQNKTTLTWAPVTLKEIQWKPIK